jgi:branched-chain amino acid transport system substrate-binding protein
MTRRKFLAIFATAILTIAVLVPGCKPKEADVVKIGAILPLTGSAATVGEFQKNGIEVAVSEINESGGINGKQVKVIYGDSKNEGKEGITVLRKMIDIEKVNVVLVSQSGVVVPIATQVASRKDVLLFVTISSVPGITELGDNIFRLFVTSENESRKMAEFASEKLLVKKVGVFYINDEFGLGGLKTFRQSFGERGGTVVWEEAYEKTGSDFRNTLLKAARARDLQALYIIGYDRAFAIAVKQAPEAGVKVPILTSIGMSVPEWINLAGPSAEGVYVTATRFDPGSSSEVIRGFVEKYNKRFSKNPNVLAAFTYDSMKLLAEGLRSGAKTAEELGQKLKQIKDYPATIGTVSFAESREANIKLVIRKIVDGKPIVFSE